MIDILIPRPIYNEGFNFKDPDTNTIAKYLYDEVNFTFYPALKGNIIKTYRDYNDNFIPTIDFPVLKVYPTSEEDSADIAPQISTAFTIAYAVAYTQRPKIGSICRLVAKEIRRLLKNGSMQEMFQLDFTTPITVDYEDFVAPDNVIYKYATISANIFTWDAY